MQQRCRQRCRQGRSHVPMHAAVAHDDVAGPQPTAQLRGHREQPDAGGAASRVRTGSCALGSDKRGYQSIQFIQNVERPHELQKKTMPVRFNMFSRKKSFQMGYNSQSLQLTVNSLKYFIMEITESETTAVYELHSAQEQRQQN